MTTPQMSKLFEGRQPSAVRMAQQAFAKRIKENGEDIKAINVSIGNVSLPMHPALIKRMGSLTSKESPFAEGVVKYTATVGLDETQEAFLNILRAKGIQTDGLKVLVTDGGSAAMELVILGTCGEPGTTDKPLFTFDPSYSNYIDFAKRVGRNTVSCIRILDEDGSFNFPSIEELDKLFNEKNPGAMLVIPWDNPTGQLVDHQKMIELAELCVKHNMWMISDEAYFGLNFPGESDSSIWNITEEEVPGINGRRIAIYSSSKNMNACGLRMGSIVTDSADFHEKATAEYTANLCANAIGQYIFGGLAKESPEDINKWLNELVEYYKPMASTLGQSLKALLNGIIVSKPDAALYSVIDVRNVEGVDDKFSSKDFVMYCATEGKVDIDGDSMTLLVSPMQGFYNVSTGEENPGRTQMRVAYVESLENMQLVAKLFNELLKQYLKL